MYSAGDSLTTYSVAFIILQFGDKFKTNTTQAICLGFGT